MRPLQFFPPQLQPVPPRHRPGQLQLFPLRLLRSLQPGRLQLLRRLSSFQPWLWPCPLLQLLPGASVPIEALPTFSSLLPNELHQNPVSRGSACAEFPDFSEYSERCPSVEHPDPASIQPDLQPLLPEGDRQPDHRPRYFRYTARLLENEHLQPQYDKTDSFFVPFWLNES